MSEDWRETLFCWKGSLFLVQSSSLSASIEHSQSFLEWRGTWCGSNTCELPSSEEYKNSKKNTFVLRAALPASVIDVLGDDKIRSGDGDGEGGGNNSENDKVMIPLTQNLFETLMLVETVSDSNEGKKKLKHKQCRRLVWKGTYQLDNFDGQGHNSYRDIAHQSKFSVLQNIDGDKSNYDDTGGNRANDDDGEHHILCVSQGVTEFGSFLSYGSLSFPSSSSSSLSTLTLCRRYLADGDCRSKWSHQQHIEHILSSSHSQTLEKPWIRLPFRHHRPRQSRKRKACTSKGMKQQDKKQKNK